MDDFKEEPITTEIPYDTEKKNETAKKIIAIVLAVLILLNGMLLVFYLLLGNSEKASGKDPAQETIQNTQTATKPEGSSAVETKKEETEEIPATQEETLPTTTAVETEEPTTASQPSSKPIVTIPANTSTEYGVVFDLVESQQVTAKILVNLRSYPGVRDDADIIGSIQHGEWATLLAVGRNGWYKVEFNGITGYAVGNYMTTDPNWQQ